MPANKDLLSFSVCSIDLHIWENKRKKLRHSCLHMRLERLSLGDFESPIILNVPVMLLMSPDAPYAEGSFRTEVICEARSRFR